MLITSTINSAWIILTCPCICRRIRCYSWTLTSNTTKIWTWCWRRCLSISTSAFCIFICTTINTCIFCTSPLISRCCRCYSCCFSSNTTKVWTWRWTRVIITSISTSTYSSYYRLLITSTINSAWIILTCPCICRRIRCYSWTLTSNTTKIWTWCWRRCLSISTSAFCIFICTTINTCIFCTSPLISRCCRCYSCCFSSNTTKVWT